MSESRTPLLRQRMKRHEALETLFCKVDLSFIQKILNEPFSPSWFCGKATDKPCQNIQSTHIVKRSKHIPSDRKLVRQMWKDPRLRKICNIEENESPCGIAVLLPFRIRVEPDRIPRISLFIQELRKQPI
jgi:hypothetical protein